MSPSDLTAAISNSLTQLDTILASGSPPFASPQWQQIFALRKHLDDLQRHVLQQTIQSNDPGFQEATGNVKTATADLTAAIAQQASVDSIIKIVSQVASAVDAVLKVV